jgi:hypothetical protein
MRKARRTATPRCWSAKASPSLAPGYFKAGTLFVDLTLGAVIMFDGNVWRNVVNGNAV